MKLNIKMISPILLGIFFIVLFTSIHPGCACPPQWWQQDTHSYPPSIFVENTSSLPANSTFVKQMQNGFLIYSYKNGTTLEYVYVTGRINEP